MANVSLKRLATVQLVLATPFTDSGSVNDTELTRLSGDTYGAGIRVFIPGAGTGEFHSLSPSESEQCLKAVRESVGSEGLVIGAVGMGLQYAKELGKRLVDQGADALLVMPSVHPYLSDEGLRDYYGELMSSLSVPFLFYKRGPFPSDQLLLELADSDQVIGIKYASTDVNALAVFTQQCQGKVAVSCGLAERFAPSFMVAGASGFTSGAANICPKLSLALHRCLWSGDNVQAVRRLEVLRPIEDYRALHADSYNVGVIKFALHVCGYDFGLPRPPLRKLDETACSDVEKIVRSLANYESEMTREHPMR